MINDKELLKVLKIIIIINVIVINNKIPAFIGDENLVFINIERTKKVDYLLIVIFFHWLEYKKL